MEAARIAESRMPETSAGKIFRTMVMNTRDSFSVAASKPSISRPKMPTSVENTRISVVQVMPMVADCLMDFWDRTDRNRIMIWGMPKYPRPQPRPDTISCHLVKGL